VHIRNSTSIYVHIWNRAYMEPDFRIRVFMKASFHKYGYMGVVCFHICACMEVEFCICAFMEGGHFRKCAYMEACICKSWLMYMCIYGRTHSKVDFRKCTPIEACIYERHLLYIHTYMETLLYMHIYESLLP
jgi:hypothetical protein